MSLRNYKALEEEDVLATATFMQRCLRLDPKNRATAEELLQDTWWQGVAWASAFTFKLHAVEHGTKCLVMSDGTNDMFAAMHFCLTWIPPSILRHKMAGGQYLQLRYLPSASPMLIQWCLEPMILVPRHPADPPSSTYVQGARQPVLGSRLCVPCLINWAWDFWNGIFWDGDARIWCARRKCDGEVFKRFQRSVPSSGMYVSLGNTQSYDAHLLARFRTSSWKHVSFKNSFPNE